MAEPSEAPAAPAETTATATAGPPDWVLPMVRRATWRVAGVVIALAVAFVVLSRARGLVSMLVIAFFFGLAMHPGVTWLSHRFGWKRGAATAVIFMGLIAFAVVLVVLLIPATVEVATRITDRLPGWLDSVQSTFNVTFSDGTSEGIAATLKDDLTAWVQTSWQNILGLVGGALGLVFQFFTIAMFTFYFAADYPKIQRTLLQRLTPDRQERLGWALDTAVTQTGGYFYSRLLLMGINGGLFFFVMLLVGVPWVVALPMSVFEGFVAEFIPAIGTYIGAAVPIFVTLGLQGVIPAVVLLIWTIVYQQVENYFLSPKISAHTMELNGGVAFAAALAGGAIAGPMGAFMALPAAAWLTSFIKHYGHSYPLTYVGADLPGGDGAAPPDHDDAASSSSSSVPEQAP